MKVILCMGCLNGHINAVGLWKHLSEKLKYAGYSLRRKEEKNEEKNNRGTGDEKIEKDGRKEEKKEKEK